MIRSLRACLLACALAWPVAVAAGDLPPNELGRVMILEYHKIDQPEERWTRTPDNFRRDLERLWERGYRLVALNDRRGERKPTCCLDHQTRRPGPGQPSSTPVPQNTQGTGRS